MANLHTTMQPPYNSASLSERFRQVDGVCCDVEGDARVAGASLRSVAGSLVGERRPAPETLAPTRL